MILQFNILVVWCKKQFYALKWGFDMVNEMFRALVARIVANDATLDTVTVTNLTEKKGASELAKALKKNRTLLRLYVLLSNINNSGIRSLSKAFAVNTKLTHLCLSDVGLNAKQTKILINGLKANPGLIALSLSHNCISTRGAQWVASLLNINHSLVMMNLACTEIGTVGTLALAEALKTNRTLIALDLSNNRIGSNGAYALAATLQINCRLRVLNLECNMIASSGFKALAATLRINEALCELDLAGNIIDVNGLQSLYEVLAVNRTLSVFPIRYFGGFCTLENDEIFHALKKLRQLMLDRLPRVFISNKPSETTEIAEDDRPTSGIQNDHMSMHELARPKGRSKEIVACGRFFVPPPVVNAEPTKLSKSFKFRIFKQTTPRTDFDFVSKVSKNFVLY